MVRVTFPNFRTCKKKVRVRILPSAESALPRSERRKIVCALVCVLSSVDALMMPSIEKCFIIVLHLDDRAAVASPR